MIGIYKITSPSGKIYIGQSINIKNRFNQYKRLYSVKNQPKLYDSFKEYGINNHIFEIIQECNIELLNEQERYWQDFYDVLENGLNSILTKTINKKGELSVETKLKKYLNHKNKINKFYILDTNNGIYYDTISEAAKYQFYCDLKIRKMLNGFLKNTTSLIKV
jgi:hypothetical protein